MLAGAAVGGSVVIGRELTRAPAVVEVPPLAYGGPLSEGGARGGSATRFPEGARRGADAAHDARAAGVPGVGAVRAGRPPGRGGRGARRSGAAPVRRAPRRGGARGGAQGARAQPGCGRAAARRRAARQRRRPGGPLRSAAAREAAAVITEDALFLGIRELGAQLRARKFTPVELAELALRRLETIGPKLGAVATVTRERALREAHRANQELLRGKDRGPLHGIPYGLKDLVAAKGAPTGWGALPLRDQTIDADATVTKRLEQAGAVLVAKLAMVELAGGMGYNSPNASFTGPGRTPWNTGYWSGGSSSGSAAAVAAGLVAFAIGSETSGSILTPSAFCGVTGLRPTYGLVSRHGAMALAWTLDKLGPLARSASDCAIVLAAIAGPDPDDATTSGDSFRYKAPAARPVRRFRLGVLRNATLESDADVERGFKQAVEALHEIADVETDVAFPDRPYGDAVRLVVSAEGAAAVREARESGKG